MERFLPDKLYRIDNLRNLLKIKVPMSSIEILFHPSIRCCVLNFSTIFDVSFFKSLKDNHEKSWESFPNNFRIPFQYWQWMHLSPSSSFSAYRVLPWHNHRFSHVFQLKSNFQSGKAIHIRCCLAVWPLADWKWVLTRNEIYCDKNQQHWVNETFVIFSTTSKLSVSKGHSFFS